MGGAKLNLYRTVSMVQSLVSIIPALLDRGCPERPKGVAKAKTLLFTLLPRILRADFFLNEPLIICENR